MTSRGIAGKKHDSSGPSMDDESILLDVQTSIDPCLPWFDRREKIPVGGKEGRGGRRSEETVEHNSSVPKSIRIFRRWEEATKCCFCFVLSS